MNQLDNITKLIKHLWQLVLAIMIFCCPDNKVVITEHKLCVPVWMSVNRMYNKLLGMRYIRWNLSKPMSSKNWKCFSWISSEEKGEELNRTVLNSFDVISAQGGSVSYSQQTFDVVSQKSCNDIGILNAVW